MNASLSGEAPLSWREALPSVAPATMKRIGAAMAAAGAGPNGALSPKHQAFLFLGVDSVVTHLHAAALATHIQSAIAHGATCAELIEVLQIACAVSTRGYGAALAALLDAADLSPADAASKLPPASAPRGDIEAFQEAFTRKAGFRPAAMDIALQVTPDFAMALLNVSEAPAEEAVLDPGTRALIGMALSSCPAINDVEGVRRYAAQALAHDVPLVALVQALQLVAGIGAHAFTVAAPHLAQAFE